MSSDYSLFADPSFNAHQYAHRVLAELSETDVTKLPLSNPAESNYPTGQNQALYNDPTLVKEDIGVAISKLNFGIEDVSKQIKNVITEDYEALLERAASVADLDRSMKTIQGGLIDLDGSLEKLRLKVRVPYQTLSQHVIRLQRLQQVSDALRRTARFILLARRLEYQMTELDKPSVPINGKTDLPTISVSTSATSLPSVGSSGLLETADRETTLSKAALSVSELEALLESDPQPLLAPHESGHTVHPRDEDANDNIEITGPIPLRYIHAVSDHIPAIKASKAKIKSEMESMVSSGLADLNQSRLASSLQTAQNLNALPQLVQSLLDDLTDAVQTRIKQAFDVSGISKELSKDSAQTSTSILYKSRLRTEPTNVTAPQWTNALWSRLEVLIEDLADCCIKVYTLEKVLELKKDAASQVPFLSEVMKVLDDKPSTTFWSVMARSLEKQSREAARGSTFLQQTLSQGYPKLLRLFHDFFSKIGVHTDTLYSETQQSPETILVLRSLAPFEALYLSRSTNKLNEVVAQSLSGGARSPPSMGEGLAIARTISNELDSARFDPILVGNVARNVAAILENFLNRMDNLVVKDRSATVFIGSVVNAQTSLNAQLASTLYHCWARLHKLQDEYPESIVLVITPAINRLHSTFTQITDPLLTAIRRDLNAIIVRVHRLDLGKGDDQPAMGGSSVYMKELSDKLGFVRSDILSRINAGDTNKEWLLSLARHVIRSFVMHVSIAKPLGESGKLQLTSDMTELEFALSSFVGDKPQSKTGLKLDSLGDDFRALRSMRPLLFLDNSQLSDPKGTFGVPTLVVLHHILVRSPLQLPHALHGWQEAEYVAWVEEHTREEALSLIEGDITHWEKLHSDNASRGVEALEYVKLCRAVLANSKHLE